MNVVTGIFVESALENARAEKDADFRAFAHDCFAKFAEDAAGQITVEDFEREICEPQFCSYLRSNGIDPADAKLMFRILDREHQGSMYLEDLLDGMLRLRAKAKFMDISLLMHETERQRRIWMDWVCSVDKNFNVVIEQLHDIE